MLPKGWRSGKVEDFFVLQRGFDLTEKEAVPGNTPVYSSSGISYYHNEAKVSGPGVVTGRKGKLGRVFYIETDYWPHDTALWIKDFKGNDPKFIKYFLDSLQLERLDAASSVPTLNRNNVHVLKCVFPPQIEQRKIAAILSTWDEAIEKMERLIEGKENAKRWTMQRLLTGKKRLAGFSKPWNTFHLGDLFTERVEVGNDHLPLLSIAREDGIIPRGDVDRKDTSNEDKSKYLRICRGDIGYNTMRMWQGVSALSTLEGIVSPAYTICTPKEGVDGKFMAYLFKLSTVIHLFYRYSQGLTSDTWNLKFFHFKVIRVTVPELLEQKAIAQVLETCEKEIVLLHKQLDALKMQKRGLMQKLLTGKWRVRTEKEVG